MKAWRAWLRNKCGPVAVEQVKNHPRFKYFSEAGEEAYQSFLGVPLIDRGVLQGVLVVQTIEPRVFREDEVRMLSEAAAQVAPVVSEARTLDRFIAPAQERLWSLARNLWWSWDHDSSSLFRDLDPVRWRQLNHNPVALLSEIPLPEIERRARELVLHSRINYAYRRQREYLEADRTWGATHAGVLRPRPVAYFSAEFGLHESIPDVFRRPGRAGRRSYQERVRPGHSADRHRPVLRPGIFPPAAGSRTAGSRKSISRPTSTSCRWKPAIGTNGEPVTVQIETRGGAIRAKVWRMKVGRCDLLLLDSNVEGNAPEDRELTSRLYGGDGAHPHPPGIAAGRRRLPRAASAMGITPGRPAPERRPQRLCRAGSDSRPHAGRGHRLRSGGAAAFRAKSFSRPTRRCPPATTALTPS